MEAARARYEVVCKLAEGGMAEVLLVRAGGAGAFEKYLVLKRMLPHLAADAGVRSMFLDEARLAGQLQHQNIAQIFDFGDIDGSLYIAMEYLHGEDTRSVLRRARELGAQALPMSHVIAIVVGAAHGLHYAHEKVNLDGVPLHLVHRDVSLSNLFVTFSGAVKVVDFGIAHAARRLTETRSGSIKGKVAYMAPEQCLGRALDRRVDVFALGIVLYELSVGQRPFDRLGDTDFEVMTRIVDGAYPDPRDVIAGFPPALASVIARALAVNADARFPTLEAMSVELEQLAEASTSLSPRRLAHYMEELFGKRVEPWVQLRGGDTTPDGATPFSALGVALDRSPAASPAVHPVAVAPTLLAAAMTPSASPPQAVPSRPVVPGRRLRPWLLASAVALAVATITVTLGLMLRGREEPPGRAHPQVMADSRVTAVVDGGARADIPATHPIASPLQVAGDASVAVAGGKTADAGAEHHRHRIKRPDARDAGTGTTTDGPAATADEASTTRTTTAVCMRNARSRLESVTGNLTKLEQGATRLLWHTRKDLEAARDYLGRGWGSAACDPEEAHPDRTDLRRELALAEQRVVAQERARKVRFSRRGRDLYFADAETGALLDNTTLNER